MAVNPFNLTKTIVMTLAFNQLEVTTQIMTTLLKHLVNS